MTATVWRHCATTDRPDRQITRQSRGFEYQYDLAQETKVKVGDRCFVANEEMIARDRPARRGPGAWSSSSPPSTLPDRHVSHP